MELQRRLLQATFDIDSAREERASGVTERGGIPHGSVEKATAGAWPACSGRSGSPGWPTGTAAGAEPVPGRRPQVLPGDPTPGHAGPAASHLAAAGSGRPRRLIERTTGVTVGRAQLACAEDLAAWTGDFYEERSATRKKRAADSDVIMMQGDGKGIAMRPEHRRNGRERGRHPPGSRRWPRSSRSPTLPRRPRAGGHRRPARPPPGAPRPEARDNGYRPSITESIEDMIAAAFNEADRRGPEHVRQRVFLVDGTNEQSPPSRPRPPSAA